MTEPSITDQSQTLAPLLKRAGAVIESEIRGRSMGGTLVSGTRIRIRCDTGADYRTGTVIAFLGGNGLVGHRIVGAGCDRRGRRHLLTRGDGSLVPDPPTEPERVLGEVIEWQDGESWRPLPPAPMRSLPGRTTAAAMLWLVRLLLSIDPRLAVRTAILLARVGRRLSPPMSSP
ncbi:MAG: hypothetical protein SGI84_03725 [Gemmatimonadota bacterium]|nr:hypothetical protein [Gemmatimonadota bacterium]